MPAHHSPQLRGQSPQQISCALSLPSLSSRGDNAQCSGRFRATLRQWLRRRPSRGTDLETVPERLTPPYGCRPSERRARLRFRSEAHSSPEKKAASVSGIMRNRVPTRRHWRSPSPWNKRLADRNVHRPARRLCTARFRPPSSREAQIQKPEPVMSGGIICLRTRTTTATQLEEARHGPADSPLGRAPVKQEEHSERRLYHFSEEPFEPSHASHRQDL